MFVNYYFMINIKKFMNREIAAWNDPGKEGKGILSSFCEHNTVRLDEQYRCKYNTCTLDYYAYLQRDKRAVVHVDEKFY